MLFLVDWGTSIMDDGSLVPKKRFKYISLSGKSSETVNRFIGKVLIPKKQIPFILEYFIFFTAI